MPPCGKEITSDFWSFEERRYLIPAKSLRELMKVIDEDSEIVTIFPYNEQVVFHLDSIYFITRVLNRNILT